MKKPNRKHSHFLEDILLSITRIQEYILNKEFSEFKKNYLIVDAVVRNFEIIGEAAKNIPEEIRIKFPEVPWKQMVGLRNQISHEYFGIDYETLWKIAKDNLQVNKVDIENAIKEQHKTENNNG